MKKQIFDRYRSLDKMDINKLADLTGKIIFMAMAKKTQKSKKEKSEISTKMILMGVLTALSSIALLIYIVSDKIFHLR